MQHDTEFKQFFSQSQATPDYVHNCILTSLIHHKPMISVFTNKSEQKLNLLTSQTQQMRAKNQVVGSKKTLLCLGAAPIFLP